MALNCISRRRLALLGATMLLSPASAFAQSDRPSTAPRDNASLQAPGTPDEQEARDDSGEIVVTGTLVRGVAPPGASPISADQNYIRSTGSDTIAQTLQTIPQLASFGTLQQPLANSPEVSTNRPNLRGLPGFNNAGGSTTLVLIDGHRVVGMGNATTSPDPDVLPPGAIQRIEIVPDGGSALYGSDAVAGVINFITFRRFDGLRVEGSYGIAEDYYRYNFNATWGQDWDTGSFYLSYNFAKSDELLGRDRDWVRQFPNANGFTALTCSPGNIEALAGQYGRPRGTVVGMPAGTATAPNQCDNSDLATVYPASQRHSFFAGLSQQLTDWMDFDLRGFYTFRRTKVQTGPATFTEILVPQPLTAALVNQGVPAVSSPFSTVAFGGFVNGQAVFVPNSPNTIDLVQQVTGQIPNTIQHGDIELDVWSFNPAFTFDLGGSFRLRALAGYGESVANFTNSAVNQTALRNSITAGLFNPFSPSTSNPAALAAITNFQDYNRTRQRQWDFMATVDGDLVQLPAGAVKVAFGLEYLGDGFRTQVGQAVPGTAARGNAAVFVNGTLVAPATVPVPRFSVSREIRSVFGEVVVPVFGGGDGPELTVSIAGRYDDYSDVGDTFNPRFGATFKPLPWISIRGAWGQSFNAPSLADDESAAISTAFVLTGSQASFFAPPAALVASGQYPAYNGGRIVALRGNAPDIQPQEAETWTVGFDIQPPVIPGLNIGATYYNIAYSNQIGLPPFETPAVVYRDFGNVITIAPSQAVINAALASANVINGPTPVAAAGVYAFIDARKRNLGDFRLDGIDFRLDYRHAVGFGSVFVVLNGTYELNRKRSNTPGGTLIDVLSANVNRFRFRTSAGAESGPVLGQITWNHRGGYDLDPAVGFVPQSEVEGFDTFDVYFRFALGGFGPAHDIALTINVDNVFDAAPPEYRGGQQVLGQQGITNGQTIGRFGRVGLSMTF